MFQSYDPPNRATRGSERLEALREVLSRAGLDGFIVPHADEYQGEYIPACAERLAWLTNFTGSAGSAIILQDKAAIFVDGRYTLQVREQVNTDLFDPQSLIDNPPAKWLAANIESGMRIGFDPWLHTMAEAKKLAKSIKTAGGELVALDNNPLDLVWADQPSPPVGMVHIQPHDHAGRLAHDKIADLAAAMEKARADACILTDPSSIAWTFNIRGNDVPHTPLPLAFAILYTNARPQLFIHPQKLDIETRAYLTQMADLHIPGELEDEVAKIARRGETVLLDPDLAAQKFALIIKEHGGKFIEEKDPARLPRAIKNAAEIAGARAAHLRDGAALVNFLHWLDQQQPGTLDEISVARKLEDFRTSYGKQSKMPLRDISFDTISGSGPHGAIVHYRVNEQTSRTLQDGELLLIDSGGQYEDGTTDITRTIAIGTPANEMRRNNTLVLKGHITLALARFPKGTRGVDLDVLARYALWQNGLDYAHGTGHGVGSYLAVHEGPQNISRRGMHELHPGMIISNEPGYYREGEYGIRIENLVLVREGEEIPGGDMPMMGFETLTLAPIDQRLIDPSLLDDQQLHWLNAYHGHVLRKLAPLLDEEVAAWLERACEPIARLLPSASA